MTTATAEARQAPARRGPVGARLPRAAQPERAVQEGRQPAQRAGPHRRHLRQAAASTASTRAICAAGSAGGPLHPAQAGLRRHLDRRREHRHARGRVLHAAGALRRRRADRGRAAHPRRDLHRVRPRHRRHLRPRERPVPLDPRRGHAGDLASGSTLSACRPPRPAATAPAWCWVAAGRRVARRGDRRHDLAVDEIVKRYIGKPEYSNLPRKFKTAISGLQDVVHEVNDVAFIGVEPSRARPRLRPVGRRRPVDQPDAGPAGRRLGAARRGARRLGGRRLGVPRLRLPPAARQGAAEVPDQGLGHREVPPGSRGRVPEAAS